MIILLIFLDSCLLLLLHSKIYSYKFKVKRLLTSVLIFHLFLLSLTYLLKLLEVLHISSMLLYPTFFILYTYFMKQGKKSGYFCYSTPYSQLHFGRCSLILSFVSSLVIQRC